MTETCILTANSYERCPRCKRAVAFFSGNEGAFMSDTKKFASDAAIPLRCPVHGEFETPAGSFRNKEL
jgi:hypothetical protein